MRGIPSPIGQFSRIEAFILLKGADNIESRDIHQLHLEEEKNPPNNKKEKKDSVMHPCLREGVLCGLLLWVVGESYPHLDA